MQIRENIPISELTTMRLGGNARYVLSIEQPADLPAAMQFAEERQLPVWFMGGGANTIGRDAGFPGVIFQNQMRGLEILEESDERLLLKGYGGEIWDDVVAFACAKGYSGIEAMSKIPGTLGAAPVQNIGAYGQDLSAVIVEAEVYDSRTRTFLVIPAHEMAMSYRHTRFNFGADAGRFFIISVTLRLRRTTLRPPFYTSLQNYIIEHHETDFTPENIRRMISEIRAAKLPDPAKIASAGSFFKNVYLDQAAADTAEENGIPVWRTNDDHGKINSGWLIEQSGLKGKLLHGMRVSSQAALVLINESAKSYADLAAARAEIIQTVAAKFGYTLEQEPVELVASDATAQSGTNHQPDAAAQPGTHHPSDAATSQEAHENS